MLNKQKVGSNQYTANTPFGTLFFSYVTPVILESNGVAFVTDKKWSVTTTKQINTRLVETGLVRKSITQDKLDAIAAGKWTGEEEVVDTTAQATAEVGGLVILIDQPSRVKEGSGYSYLTRSIEDEDAFCNALATEVDGIKWVEVGIENKSITLINGVIPVVLEYPGNEPLEAYAARKSQEILQVWERFAN